MKKNKKLAVESYRTHIMKNTVPYNNRLAIGIPMTGLLRAEWVQARYGQIIPTNWSYLEMIQWIDSYSPMGYMVADARNAVVQSAIEKDMQWLLFIDHDVMLPPDGFLRLNDYIRQDKYPIVAGLYWTRSEPAEPLIYRGRGNSFFGKWNLGDKVMSDGTHMGCTLINMKLIRSVYEASEEYMVGNTKLRRVFETPSKMSWDPETGGMNVLTGTEDLFFYDRCKTEGHYEKAGFKEFQKMKYPILVDTGICCYHIDINGTRFPGNVDLIALRNANKKPKFIK